MKSLLLLSYALNGLAALVHLEWDVGWVTADPDRSGHPRRVIGVNGVWPPPQIDVNRGDRLQVKINNKLGDWNTTMHWHGIRQRGTNNYDGPEYVTQCPIPPGHSMVYDFPVTLFAVPCMAPADSPHIDQSSGHILVPFACVWTIPGWLAWPPHRPRSWVTIQDRI